MSEYLIQGETLTGIADAIRGKTGGTDPVAVSDMAAQIEGIQAGGGDIDALIDRSITEISSDIKEIGSGAFYGCSVLKTVNFPMVTSIGSHAFYNCLNINPVDFPMATNLGNYAFWQCMSLTTVNFPMVTSIGNNAFERESNLKSANFPMATNLGSYAFASCGVLNFISFPMLTSIGDYAFRYCGTLTTADFPMATSIGRYTFNSCSKLTALVLRNENSVCVLSGTNALTQTPIDSGTGYIYVPRALLSDTDETKDYRRATNWSTYAAQFRALEDYTADGTVTGELDPAKTGT